MSDMDTDVLKKKITLLMYPEFSAYNATFVLAKELSKKGYRVTYLGPPGFKEYVQRNGFEYKVLNLFPIEKKYLNKIEDLYRQSKPGFIKRYRMKNRYLNMKVMEEIQVLDETISGDLPNLALVDSVLPNYVIPLLQRKIPTLNVSVSLLSPWNFTAPPTSSDVIPGDKVTIFSCIKNFSLWFLILSERAVRNFFDHLKLRISFGFSSFFDPIKILKKMGVKIRGTEYSSKTLLFELVTCPREFDLPNLSKKNLNNRCYAGTGVFPQRSEKPFYWGDIDKNKTIIYCTLGSYSALWGQRKRLYKAVIDAIKVRPDLQLILQVADDKDIEELYPFPQNVFAEKWVPHMEVLPHTAVIICHGGLGTVREAIYFGVPLIVFSTGRDNSGTGARIVLHNLGLKGKLKKVTPNEIITKIDSILNSSLIHQSIKKMQAVFREQEDCRIGIDFIEQFLAQTKAPAISGEKEKKE